MRESGFKEKKYEVAFCCINISEIFTWARKNITVGTV